MTEPGGLVKFRVWGHWSVVMVQAMLSKLSHRLVARLSGRVWWRVRERMYRVVLVSRGMTGEEGQE